jgi:hypothetical protein
MAEGVKIGGVKRGLSRRQLLGGMGALAAGTTHGQIRVHQKPKPLPKGAVTHDWAALLGPSHNARPPLAASRGTFPRLADHPRSLFEIALLGSVVQARTLPLQPRGSVEHHGNRSRALTHGLAEEEPPARGKMGGLSPTVATRRPATGHQLSPFR